MYILMYGSKRRYDRPIEMTKLAYDDNIEVISADLLARALDDLNKAHEKEGYVLNIDEFMVKVKCDDYVNIHRILSNVSSINLIIEKIANDEFDDMISKIPTAYRDRVMKVANLIFNYIKSIDKEIKKLYNKADKTDKKTFMLWVNNNVSKEYRGYLRNLYLGLDVNYLKSGQRYKKLKEMGINENYSAIFSEEE